jgi:hypothetical protein
VQRNIFSAADSVVQEQVPCTRLEEPDKCWFFDLACLRTSTCVMFTSKKKSLSPGWLISQLLLDWYTSISRSLLSKNTIHLEKIKSKCPVQLPHIQIKMVLPCYNVRFGKPYAILTTKCVHQDTLGRRFASFDYLVDQEDAVLIQRRALLQPSLATKRTAPFSAVGRDEAGHRPLFL